MHPRSRLWIRARRGPSAIFKTSYNPAASSTSAADPVDHRDPCSCHSSCPRATALARPDHAEPMETPLLPLTPSPGDTPTAPTRSDALGDAAELRFADSIARYSRAVRSESSTLSRRATPRCVTSLSAGHGSCRPTFWRATSRTSVHPSLTSKSWQVRVDYIQLTTTSSYSHVTRHCRQRGLTTPALRGELLAC